MTTPLLKLSVLGIRFGGLVAVDAVDLTVAPSTITCIIGPNGAGKSTLFNLITGIYRPTSGTVALQGDEITGLPAHKIAMRGIARTFQSSRLFEDLSILDNVIIGMYGRTRTGVLTALLRPAKSRRERRPAPPRPRRSCAASRTSFSSAATSPPASTNISKPWSASMPRARPCC